MGGGRLEPGTRLGNFEIVELIGSGGRPSLLALPEHGS